jgi:hypothetical protein
MRLIIAGGLLAIALLILSSQQHTCLPHDPDMYGSHCISPSVYRYGYPVAFWLIVIGGIMAWLKRRREEQEED